MKWTDHLCFVNLTGEALSSRVEGAQDLLEEISTSGLQLPNLSEYHIILLKFDHLLRRKTNLLRFLTNRSKWGQVWNFILHSGPKIRQNHFWWQHFQKNLSKFSGLTWVKVKVKGSTITIQLFKSNCHSFDMYLLISSLFCDSWASFCSSVCDLPWLWWNFRFTSKKFPRRFLRVVN